MSASIPRNGQTTKTFVFYAYAGDWFQFTNSPIHQFTNNKETPVPDAYPCNRTPIAPDRSGLRHGGRSVDRSPQRVQGDDLLLLPSLMSRAIHRGARVVSQPARA